MNPTASSDIALIPLTFTSLSLSISSSPSLSATAYGDDVSDTRGVGDTTKAFPCGGDLRDVLRDDDDDDGDDPSLTRVSFGVVIVVVVSDSRPCGVEARA